MTLDTLDTQWLELLRELSDSELDRLIELLSGDPVDTSKIAEFMRARAMK